MPRPRTRRTDLRSKPAPSPMSGIQAASRLLGRPIRPDAVFCANDFSHRLHGCGRAGSSDSTALAIVVVLRQSLCPAGHPDALTTVRQPVGKMIDVTMELIGQRFRRRAIVTANRALSGRNLSNAPSTAEGPMSSSREEHARSHGPGLIAGTFLPSPSSASEPEVAEVDAPLRPR